MKASVILTVLTSASASLCCIVPFLAVAGGSGSLISSVSWLEPYRPFFIGGTVLFLGLAWYQAIRAHAKDDCGCEKQSSLFQSRKFLAIITILSFLLISFPSYSRFLTQEQESVNLGGDQDKNKKVSFSVSGMTCASCERHIESEVIKLSGVSSVKASYTSKSATIEYDPQKIDEAKIVAAINETGYRVQKSDTADQEKTRAGCCTKGSSTAETCTSMLKVSVPNERSKNLKVLAKLDDLKNAFNKQAGKVKFVAILSSTCCWCLQGAQAVQQAVVEQMSGKDMRVIIVWTNMLKSDDKDNAFKAASLFKDASIVQYYDAENKFGDIVARRLSPKGVKAWDLYMFFDKDDQWTGTMPRPFEYAHQLNESLHPWADQTKYFCGLDLTKRLSDIITSL